VTPETLWNYFQIQRGIPEKYDLYWAYRGNELPFWLSALPIETFQLTDERLAEWHSAMKGDTLVPGNTHILTIAFSECHEYERYWFIEYDVWFAGDWGRVFRLAQESEAELIAALMESPFDDESWFHWDTIHLPYGEVARSFNPIRRVSERVLEKVVALLTKGYWAHNEALLASVCQNREWDMDDLNTLAFNHWGTPLYTPPNAAAASTLDYRPVASPIWSRKENRLHHPVKPIQWFSEQFGTRRGLVKAFKAHPGDDRV
jgi:hypothetical protein